MTGKFRRDVQNRLCRFFEGVTRSRATLGDPVLAVGSTIGPHRDDNEDRAGVAIIRYPHDRRPRLQIAIVCDGMGGMAEGGRAASQAIAAFISAMSVPDQPLDIALSNAVQLANRSVFDLLQGNGGSTLTAVVTDGREAWCAHVGDSRLYMAGPEGLTLLTQDDTIQGAIHAHEGRSSEDELDNRLLQFVGIGDQLVPHVFSVPMKDDHLWIVTSDGAHGIGRKALEALLKGARTANDVARKAIFVADALNVTDNASIAVMRQLDSYDQEPPHGGTSISVSSPVRSLELWLSESFEDPAPKRAIKDVKEPEPKAITPTAPDVEPPTKKVNPRKRSQSKPAIKQQHPDPGPMEVLFESKKIDDISS